ncbi:MAG: non-ribosomal peptide synthetase [Caldilineales bacterium]|nr:non-ribosomal peptide synthetase [Caldilineales bacterium]
MKTNDQSLVFEPDEVNSSIPDRFETVARLAPERAAIRTDAISLTYRQLDQQANQLAHAILSHTHDPHVPVALLLDQEHQVIVAIMAVLKAGRFYTALRATSSPDYLRELIGFSETDLIVTDNEHLSLAGSIVGTRTISSPPLPQVLNIDSIDLHASGKRPDCRVAPDDLMGVFFTSGTTGKPKGVMRTHRRVLHSAYTEGLDYGIQPEDRCNLFYHAAFGASSSYLFMALLNGATLLPLNGAAVSPDAFLEQIRKHKLSVAGLSPTYLRACLDFLDHTMDESLASQLETIRLIILGGEPVTRSDIERVWRYVNASCSVVHRLALTEAGAVTSLQLTRHDPIEEGQIPAGYPCSGYDVSVVNDRREVVPTGDIGEIIVRSRYLAPGYWRQPEITAQKFLTDPDVPSQRIYLTGDLGRFQPNGMLEHLGRKDNAVKIRGFRVETEAVERVLRNAPGVIDVAVVAKSLPDAERELAAYVVSHEPEKSTALRQFLREHVPDYMIPTLFIYLEALPLTANGKVDRLALAALPTLITRSDVQKPYRSPETPLEAIIAGIWADVLGMEGVGIDDDFIGLGGDSIKAARILARVNQALGVDLPFPLLAESGTIAVLAKRIEYEPMAGFQLAALSSILDELEADGLWQVSGNG